MFLWSRLPRVPSVTLKGFLTVSTHWEGFEDYVTIKKHWCNFGLFFLWISNNEWFFFYKTCVVLFFDTLLSLWVCQVCWGCISCIQSWCRAETLIYNDLIKIPDCKADLHLVTWQKIWLNDGHSINWTCFATPQAFLVSNSFTHIFELHSNFDNSFQPLCTFCAYYTEENWSHVNKQSGP